MLVIHPDPVNARHTRSIGLMETVAQTEDQRLMTARELPDEQFCRV